MAYHLDGSTQYLDIPSVSVSASITVLCWVKSDVATWNNNGFISSSRQDVSTLQANGWIIHPNSGTGNVAFYIADSAKALTLLGTVAAGTITNWQLYGFTFDSVTTNVSLWINNSKSSTTYAGTRSSTTNSVTVGRDGALARYLDGMIYDHRIYNRALTDAEWGIIYKSYGGDGIVNGLVSRYLMNEGPENSTATTAVDLAGGSSGTPQGSPTFRAVPLRTKKCRML